MKPRRRIWGLTNSRASIGYEREVTVDVHTDRIVIAGDLTIRIGRGETDQEVTEGFIAALDQHAHSWGRPPKDFYWVPTLRFVVAPDANEYYERLQADMAEWGVRSRVERKRDQSEHPSEPTR